MELTDNITLRPHHISLLSHFRGHADTVRVVYSQDPKYGPETAAKFAELFQALYDRPDTRITVVEEPDAICALCHNLVDGKCQTSTDEQLARADRSKRGSHGITERTYTVEEVYDLRDMFFGMRI